MLFTGCAVLASTGAGGQSQYRPGGGSVSAAAAAAAASGGLAGGAAASPPGRPGGKPAGGMYKIVLSKSFLKIS